MHRHIRLDPIKLKWPSAYRVGIVIALRLPGFGLGDQTQRHVGEKRGEWLRELKPNGVFVYHFNGANLVKARAFGGLVFLIQQ